MLLERRVWDGELAHRHDARSCDQGKGTFRPSILDVLRRSRVGLADYRCSILRFGYGNRWPPESSRIAAAVSPTPTVTNLSSLGLCLRHSLGIKGHGLRVCFTNPKPDPTTSYSRSLLIVLIMNRYTIALNNFYQNRGQSNLISWTECPSGPSHAITWTMTCRVAGEVVGSATAAQKGVAKEKAAQSACQALGISV
ncbi:hypothetical protein BV22DRAFT_627546 [Leucogyrophana mollusca]|uniref:Uncharacterized protein n=1 Tax=Leucogyrophana mollusca TaxID=85980 RepID=A0ACB8BB72_9AGAM|nr:hypothetical protein BV22DRAFT_627546 [Leucogyrophana mollusca]